MYINVILVCWAACILILSSLFRIYGYLQYFKVLSLVFYRSCALVVVTFPVINTLILDVSTDAIIYHNGFYLLDKDGNIHVLKFLMWNWSEEIKILECTSLFHEVLNIFTIHQNVRGIETVYQVMFFCMVYGIQTTYRNFEFSESYIVQLWLYRHSVFNVWIQKKT